MVIRGRENRAGLPSNMSGDGIAQEKKGTSNKRNKPSVTRKSKRKQKRKEEKDREREVGLLRKYSVYFTVKALTHE